MLSQQDSEGDANQMKLIMWQKWPYATLTRTNSLHSNYPNKQGKSWNTATNCLKVLIVWELFERDCCSSLEVSWTKWQMNDVMIGTNEEINMISHFNFQWPISYEFNLYALSI